MIAILIAAAATLFAVRIYKESQLSFRSQRAGEAFSGAIVCVIISLVLSVPMTLALALTGLGAHTVEYPAVVRAQLDNEIVFEIDGTLEEKDMSNVGLRSGCEGHIMERTMIDSWIYGFEFAYAQKFYQCVVSADLD